MGKKKTLESYLGDYLVTVKGVIQFKLVNETITSQAYQDYIKSDIKLQYESGVNIARRVILLNAWGIVHSYRSFTSLLTYPDMPYW